MKLERSLDRWSGMSPEAIAKGSEAQIIYALKDAKADIATLAGWVEHYQAAHRRASEKLCALSQRVYGKGSF